SLPCVSRSGFAVKHFRELRRHSAGGIIGDCFTVLCKTHMVTLQGFSCFQLILFSPTVAADAFSLDTQIYIGFSQIFDIMQLSVLGPRLILSVREYHAKLVADSDTATAMSSMAFQEHVHMEN
ncbi:uncharacterized protein EDB93DRAFT_1107608, partial [Suillus bovinus]|uniref:uncharacterized protein n=1 Tax=Suillus bovinus TaxID=48563 RepID=UPI001B869B47